VVADGSQGQGFGDHVFIDPAAIPALRDAFADALARVDRQIELASHDLRVSAWANDPVSAKATTSFNARSIDSDESALSVLRAYRGQLSTAVDALDRTALQYRVSEEDNSVTVGKQEETGI
jgi:hypothetical protein